MAPDVRVGEGDRPDTDPTGFSGRIESLLADGPDEVRPPDVRREAH